MNWTLTLTGYDTNELKALLASLPADTSERLVTRYDIPLRDPLSAPLGSTRGEADDTPEQHDHADGAVDETVLLKGEAMFNTRTTLGIAKASVDAIYAETKTVGCANGDKLTGGDRVKIGPTSTAVVLVTYKKAVIVGLGEDDAAMVLRPDALTKVTAPAAAAPAAVAAPAEGATMDELRVMGGRLLDLVGATTMVAILKASAGVSKLRDIDDQATLDAAFAAFSAAVEKAEQ